MQERQEGAEKLHKEEMVSPITNDTQDLNPIQDGMSQKSPLPLPVFLL